MSKAALWVGVVILLFAGAWWWMAQSPSPAPAANEGASSSAVSQGVSSASSTGTKSGAPMSAAVTYDGASFSPASVTVAQGGTVTFTDTAGQMWIASDPHPSHTGYDGTSRTEHCAAGYAGPAPFDQCSGGASFSFTFDQVGSWGYHDHLNHNARATVVVVAQ